MIRVNLLPFRAARERENIRKQVSIFLLLVLFVFLALWYSILFLGNEISALEGKIAGVKNEISIYKKKADRVTEIQKLLDKLEQKLKVVSDFNALRREPFMVLNQMTNLIVPERMWLTSLKSKGSNVILNGVAFDNKTVADFMTKIEDSSIYSGVNLVNLQLKEMKNAKVKTFELQCQKGSLSKNASNPDKKK